MPYTISRSFQGADFGDIVARTKKTLADNGFGVLSEIDVKATLKNKIGEDIDDYLILGACNPAMAYRAIQLEPRVGTMLPCNVIVRSLGGGGVEVSAVDPVQSMEAIPNDDLKHVAGEVRRMLAKAVGAI